MFPSTHSSYFVDDGLGAFRDRPHAEAYPSYLNSLTVPSPGEPKTAAPLNIWTLNYRLSDASASKMGSRHSGLPPSRKISTQIAHNLPTSETTRQTNS